MKVFQAHNLDFQICNSVYEVGRLLHYLITAPQTI